MLQLKRAKTEALAIRSGLTVAFNQFLEAPAFNQFMEDCLSKLKAERLRTEQRTQYISEEM